MRSLKEVCELFKIDETTGAAILRSRDSLHKLLQCSYEEMAAVEDYLFALCLSLGRDAQSQWRVSPVILYGSLIIMVGFQELSDAMSDALKVWNDLGIQRQLPLVETYLDTPQPQE